VHSASFGAGMDMAVFKEFGNLMAYGSPSGLSVLIGSKGLPLEDYL